MGTLQSVLTMTLLLLSGLPGWATDSYMRTHQKIPKSPWSASFEYFGKADLANTAEERTFSHNIETSLSFRQNDQISWGTSLGANYYSLGNTIVKEEGNPALSDWALSVSQNLYREGTLNLFHSLGLTLPTSFDSQYEGISGTLGYGVSLTHPILWLKVGHSVSLDYIQHTYDYSPTTAKLNNPWGGGYSLNLNLPWKITRSISTGLSETLSQHTNLSGEFRFRSSTHLHGSYSFKQLSLNLSYLIGSYDENQSMRFSDRDEWHQKVSFGLSYGI
jgi:hypothetical protein